MDLVGWLVGWLVGHAATAPHDSTQSMHMGHMAKVQPYSVFTCKSKVLYQTNLSFTFHSVQQDYKL
jgi:hypothetical protein